MAKQALLLLLLLGLCRGQFQLPQYPIPEPSSESGYVGRAPLDFSPFEEALVAGLDRMDELDDLLLSEGISVAKIQQLLTDGTLTSVDLVTYYVRRIKQYDEGTFNSVAQINPRALDEARASDTLRRGTVDSGDDSSFSQPRSPLEGVPILVKWNVAIADLATTAGASAMAGWVPSRDASLVSRLRNSGAVILGHAALSEWANYLDPSMPNGFSAMGGQVRPAYGAYDPYGSSTGSAVAVSASFAPLAVGTETYGSIISPSIVNSVVGLRPSTGLVSGDYVIPLCSALDTAGPMAKSVLDLAAMLTAMTGVDPGEPPSPADELKGVDFAHYAKSGDTHPNDEVVRVGIPFFPDDASSDPRLKNPSGMPLDNAYTKAYNDYFQDENEKYMSIGQILKDNGVKVTTFDPMDLFLGFDSDDFFLLLEYCMKDSFDVFASLLAPMEPTFPWATLAEVVAFNEQDPKRYIPYGQAYLKQSAETTVTSEEFESIRNKTMVDARALLDSVFSESGADVILTNNLPQTYSRAGYPALTVPGGYLSLPGGKGVQPTGTVFSARYLGDSELLRVGYIYEQATKVRVNPDMENIRTSATNSVGRASPRSLILVSFGMFVMLKRAIPMP